MRMLAIFGLGFLCPSCDDLMTGTKMELVAKSVLARSE